VKRILLFPIALIGLAGLAAAVSAQPAPRPALQAPATPVVPVADATAIPAEPTAEPIPASNCVTCHANQEQLMALAEAPVETGSLNEGSG